MVTSEVTECASCMKAEAMADTQSPLSMGLMAFSWAGATYEM